MRFAILILFVLLAGCGSLAPSLGYQGLTADQIAAAAKDKNSGANCVEFTGMGGSVKILTLSNDAGVIKSGSATLKCGGGEATFSNGEAKKP